MLEHERPWKTLSSRQVIDTPYLKIRCEQVALPGGMVIPDYYIIENRGWVGIVPITEDGRFLLNNQYKHGIGCEVLEFPAGGIDEHEDDPVQAAHRELMEETGYSTTPDQMEPLAEMLANPTGAVTRAWWYLARNVRLTGEQKLDPAEVIKNCLVTPAELLHLIHSGQFAVQGQIAAAYMALERLGLLKTTF
ncbi:MAG TPA: NUDIX hydrolase [Ktedonosporobacter sp.]|nr:NUDIX hydrolase [Ktedonosporobacter sp.]